MRYLGRAEDNNGGQQMTTEAQIEVTDEEFDKFALAFWGAIGERSASDDPYPRTRVPADGSDDILEADEMKEVGDHEQAEKTAQQAFNVIHGRTGSGLSHAASRAISPRKDWEQRAVFVVPQWFANDEWGVWQSVFIARFTGETKSGKSLKFENIIGWKDRGEDDYFLEPTEFSTVPKSLCTVFTGVSETATSGVVFERGLDSDEMNKDEDADPREAQVTFTGVKNSQYGTKLVLDFEPPWGNEDEHEAIKQSLNEMPWDAAHATFDGDDWVMDPGYAVNAIFELTAHGFTVGFTEDVREFVKENVDPDLVDGLDRLAEVEF